MQQLPLFPEIGESSPLPEMDEKLRKLPAPEHWPKPTGYRMLVAMPEVEDTFASGIAKASVTAEIEQSASVLGVVLAMGDDCYGEKEKFPNGPWCKEGDYVLIGAYRGTRFKINGYQMAVVNDTQVEAVIPRESVGVVQYSRF